MKFSAIWRESVRNTKTGTARAGTFAVLLAAVMGGAVAADLHTVVQISAEGERFRNSGAATYTMAAAARIDGNACERLADIEGIVDAGALRHSQAHVITTTLRTSPIATFEVTPLFPALLGATTTGAGPLAGPELVETLGPSARATIETLAGPIQVGGTYRYPADGRRAGFGYALLEPVTSTGLFDECWVNIWPSQDDLSQLLFSTLREGTDSQQSPELSQLNTSHGSEFNGAELLKGRITRLAAPVCASVGVLLGMVAVRLRRVQIASALHAGVSRRSQILMLNLEAIAWALPAAVLATAAALALERQALPDVKAVLLLLAVRATCAGALGVLSGTTFAVALVRESHLFRYFKTR